jgi:DNA-binding XRE family transcriptional regulator
MYNHILRGLIVNRGLTQEKFSKLIGISNVTLSHIMRGYNCKLKNQQLIADYFNKPINSIFKGRVK